MRGNSSSTFKGSKRTRSWFAPTPGTASGPGRKTRTHLLSSATSSAVQGTPRVIREMLLMAGLTNARHVVTADRTQTTALNLPLHGWKQTKSISKGGRVGLLNAGKVRALLMGMQAQKTFRTEYQEPKKPFSCTGSVMLGIYPQETIRNFQNI